MNQVSIHSKLLKLLSIFFLLIGIAIGASTFFKHKPETQYVVSAIFIFLSSGGLFLSRRLKQIELKVQDLKNQYPQQAWMWREDWAQGFATASEKRGSIVFIVLGSLFIAFTSPAMMNLQKELALQHYKILVALVIPLVGLFMVLKGVQKYLLVKKWGDPKFVFSKVGTLGGKLTGNISVKCNFSEPIKVTLANKRVSTTDTGDDQKTFTHILWQSETEIQAQSSIDGSIIPIQFHIPFDLRATEDINSKDSIQWELVVQSPQNNFLTTYLVPVFKTSESNPNFIQEVEIQKEVTFDDHFEPKSFSQLTTANGLEVKFFNNNQ